MSSREQRNDMPQFGIPQSNYDWVECESRSVPGRLYYFNLRTSCKTWTKPISRYTNIPRFTALRVPTRVASSTESPTLMTSEDKMGISNDNLPPSSSGSLDSREIMKAKVLDYLSRLDAGKVGNDGESVRPAGNAETSSMTDVSSCSTCNACNSECSESNVSDKTVASNSSSSPCPCCVPQFIAQSSNENRQGYAAPRLKSIGPHDLLPKSSLKRSRRLAQRRKVSKRPTRIVCDMYGTRTVNYNCPILPDVPRRGFASDASSSSRLSLSDQKERHCTQKYIPADRDLVNFPELNLSESSGTVS